jgi:hypothetical protein
MLYACSASFIEVRFPAGADFPHQVHAALQPRGLKHDLVAHHNEAVGIDGVHSVYEFQPCFSESTPSFLQSRAATGRSRQKVTVRPAITVYSGPASAMGGSVIAHGFGSRSPGEGRYCPCC